MYRVPCTVYPTPEASPLTHLWIQGHILSHTFKVSSKHHNTLVYHNGAMQTFIRQKYTSCIALTYLAEAPKEKALHRVSVLKTARVNLPRSDYRTKPIWSSLRRLSAPLTALNGRLSPVISPPQHLEERGETGSGGGGVIGGEDSRFGGLEDCGAERFVGYRPIEST